jgi:hypothetical protein
MEISTEERVLAEILTPHTTEIFQLLDLKLFSVFKRVGHHQLTVDDSMWAFEFIDSFYLDFEGTPAAPYIWDALTWIELEFTVRQTPYQLFFDREQLSQSKEFNELHEINFPLAALSDRRCPAPFGELRIPG